MHLCTDLHTITISKHAGFWVYIVRSIHLWKHQAQGSAAALRQQAGNLFSVAAIIQLNSTAFLSRCSSRVVYPTAVYLDILQPQRGCSPLHSPVYYNNHEIWMWNCNSKCSPIDTQKRAPITTAPTELFVERSHTNLDQDAPLIRKLEKALQTTEIQGSGERIYEPGVKFVAYAQALLVTGSAKWSLKFSNGPLPVTIACTKNPNMENIASLPFLSSFTLSSAKVSGSSAKPKGSNEPPG